MRCHGCSYTVYGKAQGFREGFPIRSIWCSMTKQDVGGNSKSICSSRRDCHESKRSASDTTDVVPHITSGTLLLLLKVSRLLLYRDKMFTSRFSSHVSSFEAMQERAAVDRFRKIHQMFDVGIQHGRLRIILTRHLPTLTLPHHRPKSLLRGALLNQRWDISIALWFVWPLKRAAFTSVKDPNSGLEVQESQRNVATAAASYARPGQRHCIGSPFDGLTNCTA